MRILIVGGGVAGLTLAAKLRQQGREPVVVEKSAEYRDVGYGIGLYPMGSCVLHGLGVYDEFVARGMECYRYEVADHTGEVLQGLDMSVLTDNAGPMILLNRSELINVLRRACRNVAIRMNTTVESILQTSESVEVTFSDRTAAEFDLVVACDGIHSQMRRRIFAKPEVFDTGWTVWTWWGREGLFAPHLVREYWGHGSFFGFYPVPGRCMFVAGLPNEAAPDQSAPESVRATIASALGELPLRVCEVRTGIEDAESLYAWPMADVRARQWHSGRVALCGDAAAAFLPTAGIGASCALRSAAALADELSRADAAHVSSALELYAKRCRKVVEANQDDSRSAARYMFVESRVLGWGRDQIIKHYPADRVVRQIIQSMREPF